MIGDRALVADCANCVGLCCVALAFVRAEDFAFSKDGGEECRNLAEDYRCTIHPVLRSSGMKGCTVFDCHGAGQRVTQNVFAAQTWRGSADLGDAMFSVFRVVRALHDMLWYLRAGAFAAPESIVGPIQSMYERVNALGDLPGDQILALDLDELRNAVNPLLRGVSESVRGMARRDATIPLPGAVRSGADLIGVSLAGHNLRGADLRGAILIGADLGNTDLRDSDLISADLRDANLGGADLSTALFVTQMQLNAASGDGNTLLPRDTLRPQHWT